MFISEVFKNINSLKWKIFLIRIRINQLFYFNLRLNIVKNILFQPTSFSKFKPVGFVL